MPSYVTDPLDPNDIDDLSWDWGQRLAIGETIATATLTVVDGSATLSTPIIDGTVIVARVSAASMPRLGIRARITTSTGRQLDHTITVAVQEQ